MKKFLEKLYPNYNVETWKQFQTRSKLNHNSEMEGIILDIKKIKFFDEDLKKMESMNLKEKTAYIRKLKSENKYTYEEKL